MSDEERSAAWLPSSSARCRTATEVQVYRFPNALCTDHGRAINQQEQGWETTLTGLPKEMYQFWERQLRARRYKIKFQIVDFPDGMPGDVGITLKWA